MIYIEDALAGVIRCAAGLELVPGIDEAHVFTDEDAENEWQGEDKIYVLRGESNTVYDVTSDTGHSGSEISEVGLVSIAAARSEAQRLAVSVWKPVLGKLSDKSWAGEYEGAEAPEPLFRLSGADEAELDQLDESSVEYGEAETVDFAAEVKDYASLFHLADSDSLSLAAADRWKASAFRFGGDVSGSGVWIGGAVFAAEPPQITFKTSNLGIYDWILDRYTTAARADGGAFRDQWFSTYTIRAIHSI